MKIVKSEILENIKSLANQNFSASFRAIAIFIIANSKNLDKWKINDIASQTFTSPSTVTRFCKKIGVNGFKQLIPVLRFELDYEKPNKFLNDSELHNDKLYLHYKTISSALYDCYKINYDIIKAIGIDLFKTRKVFLFAAGGNNEIVNLFYKNLIRLGFFVIYHPDIDQQFAYAHLLDDESISFFISYSSKSASIINCFELAKTLKSSIILITRNLYSSIIADAKYVVVVPTNESMIENHSKAEISILFLLEQIVAELLKSKEITKLYQRQDIKK